MNPWRLKLARLWPRSAQRHDEPCLVVGEGTLHAARVGEVGQWTLIHSAPLSKLTRHKAFLTPRIVVVPDYWLGTFTHAFQGSRTSLIEAFVVSKLRTDREEFADGHRYFDFEFYDHGVDDRRLSVCHLDDARAFELLDQLLEMGASPHHITTPALLWSKQLRRDQEDFAAGGSSILHMCAGQCRLYYYFQGQYLFSRVLTLPETADINMLLEHIVYELTQSAYLVSQRAKAEVARLFLNASSPELRAKLGDHIPYPVIDVSDDYLGGRSLHPDFVPLAFVNAQTLRRDDGLWRVTEREGLQERNWRPVQNLGMVLGGGALLTAAVQAAFVGHWINMAETAVMTTTGLSDGEVRQRLSAHQQDLSALIEASDRPSIQRILAALAAACPQEVGIDALTIELEEQPSLTLSGAVIASGAAGLVDTLSALRKGLRASFGETLKLDLGDFQVAPVARPLGEGLSAYDVEFGLELP